MSPSAVSPPQSTTELTKSGVAHTIAKTAPSITQNGSSTLAELDAGLLEILPTISPRPYYVPGSPELYTNGTYCTDHMITCSWTAASGWQRPQLKAYGPLSIMPTASVLHYATECFEGMKLYRGFDGRLRLFRPDRNVSRLVRSATRIALPAFDPAEVLSLVHKLCATDAPKWLPATNPGVQLYIRPTIIADDPSLGVEKPRQALLYIILSFLQVNNQVPGGVRLLASDDDTVRAWPGGFGFAKLGANYGPTLLAQGEARRRGFGQVLWLLGDKVTEAGASNFFIVLRSKTGQDQLVTAPLGDNIILDGVTRRSVLDLARERLHDQLEVQEREFKIGEVVQAAAEGRIVEAFSAGTAWFVSPVSGIHYRGKDIEIPMSEGSTGRYALMLKTWLYNIMYGKEKHDWGYVVDEEVA